MLASIVVLAGWAALAAESEPVALRLRLQPETRLLYREQLTGSGSLTRRGETEQRLELTVRGEARRQWRVLETEPEGWWVEARALAGTTRLQVAERTFIDGRAPRSFRLHVGLAGQVIDAAAMVAEAADAGSDSTVALGPEPDAELPPLDLDLGELFCLLELGVLPPEPVQVGSNWKLPPDADTDSPLRLEGRVAELEAGRARLVTQYRATVPERATPIADVVVRGTLEGSLEVWFDRRSGTVQRAGGPLRLHLEYARRGRAGVPVASLELSLELVAERDEAPPEQAARPGR